MNISEITKTIVTGLGLVVSLGTFALPYVTDLSPQIAAIISAVCGVATIILNYVAPNETADPARVEGRSVRLKGTEPFVAGRHERPE